LTIDELASACRVSSTWVVEHVEAGLLVGETHAGSVLFSRTHLARARRMVDIEHRFDANHELAALVADLMEELDQLRRQLGVPRQR
jgi:chaperone modulatory protein CbpM